MAEMMQDNMDAAAEERRRAPADPGHPYSGPAAWGRNLYSAEDSRRKLPILAGVLSLMPGLGQIYVGYYPQGFINVLVVGSLIALLNRGVGAFEPLCGIFLAFFWLHNVVDAWRRATLYNLALAGLGPGELPEAVSIPKSRGSLAGGAALILLGAILLAHTRFGLPVEWIEQWWPVAFILLGAYLVYKAVQDRGQAGTR
ncbi:MAG: hypothetical protein FJW35_13755 [Acidobacteria bacterium]|nr:hypothetical protein [Acidobacteriota bacterium]